MSGNYDPSTNVSADSLPESADIVLAIDPGRAKCGIAVVHRDGQVLARTIVATANLVAQVTAWVADYGPVALLIGAGTGSRPLRTQLERAGLPLPLIPVSEAHTSEAARCRFVQENPARGWQRLLPRCLRTPCRAYDDYAAIILAERFWQKEL